MHLPAYIIDQTESNSLGPTPNTHQAILLTPSKAGLPPLARVAAMEIVTRALQIKARQLSPGLASEVQAAVFKNWKCAYVDVCLCMVTYVYSQWW